MSKWNGRHGRGAMRLHREAKRAEAEDRNARTPLERRRAYREADTKTKIEMESADGA